MSPRWVDTVNTARLAPFGRGADVVAVPDRGGEQVAVVPRLAEATFDRGQPTRIPAADRLDQRAAREAERVLPGEDRTLEPGCHRELGIDVNRVVVVPCVAVEQRLDREGGIRHRMVGRAFGGSAAGAAGPRSPPNPPSPITNNDDVDVNTHGAGVGVDREGLELDQRAGALVENGADAGSHPYPARRFHGRVQHERLLPEHDLLQVEVAGRERRVGPRRRFGGGERHHERRVDLPAGHERPLTEPRSDCERVQRAVARLPRAHRLGRLGPDAIQVHRHVVLLRVSRPTPRAHIRGPRS